MAKTDTKPSYRVGKVTSYDEVPAWVRRQRKWTELTDLVDQLKPGQSLPVEFDSEKDARNAANTVRTDLNKKYGEVAVSTRVVAKDPETQVPLDTPVVHFTILPEAQKIPRK